MITHSLSGYDRATEFVAEEFPIGAKHLTEARKLAHVPATDPQVAGSYPLSSEEAIELAKVIGVAADPLRCHYFLEGFAAS